LAVWCQFAHPVAGWAANFTASLDRDLMTMGENATLSLNFEGSDQAPQPNLPTVPGLTFNGPSTSSQRSVSFVNGNVQSSISVTYSYAVTPAKTGVYTIPAMRMVVDGQNLTSQPIKLTVLERGKGQANVGGAFLKLVVPKNEVYVGEILPVEVQLYYLALQGAEMPHFNEEGFTLGKMLKPAQSATTVNGRNYQMAVFKSFVVPAKVGKLDLGPATMAMNVPRSNARNMFGQLTDWRNVTLESDPLTLQVLPLPKENVPPGFNGAVGSFSLAINASPTNIAVGDPVTVKVQITGHGELEGLSLPTQTGWEQFKVYPPTSDFQANDDLGTSGTRTFSLTAVPQTMDTKELPSYIFSYFDPEQKSYRTVTQPAIPLIVRPSAASLPPPSLANVNNSNENPTPNQDLSPLKPRLGDLATFQPPLVAQPWFLALQGIPVLAWLALLIRRRQADRLANNPRLRREREVAQSVSRSLKELRHTANANQAEAFFATVFRLLQERLGERLDLPASAITEAVLDERLRQTQVPEELLARVRELFQKCNEARYGRQSTNEELVSLIPKVEAAMNDLKNINA